MGSGGSPSLWPPGQRSPGFGYPSLVSFIDHRRPTNRDRRYWSTQSCTIKHCWVQHCWLNVRRIGHCTCRIRNAAKAAQIQANRAISTGKLHALPHFHTQPINVVVSHGSQGRISFEAGFPLRCFQRLSLPYIATRLCRWRDNRSTRGTSTPVLSY